MLIKVTCEAWLHKNSLITGYTCMWCSYSVSFTFAKKKKGVLNKLTMKQT